MESFANRIGSHRSNRLYLLSDWKKIQFIQFANAVHRPLIWTQSRRTDKNVKGATTDWPIFYNQLVLIYTHQPVNTWNNSSQELSRTEIIDEFIELERAGAIKMISTYRLGICSVLNRHHFIDNCMYHAYQNYSPEPFQFIYVGTHVNR